MSKHVAVLLGGRSPERDVSLVSGRKVIEALEAKGYQVSPIDPRDHDWIDQLDGVKPDVVFNALHGDWGEDGRVQGVLDYLGYPYTHSGVAASALAMDKQRAKAVLREAGIQCPEGQLISRFEAARDHVMKPPYVAKPNAQGSSVGVVIVFVMLVLTFATTRDAATRFSSEALTEGAGVRGQLITTMLGHWLGNPVAIVQGLGTSAFQYYWQLDDTPYVHNMPVQVITEQGLIGLFLLSVILYLTARAGIQLLRMYKDYPTELSAAAILVGFCLYQFLISLKQGNYFTIAAPFWSFLLLAKVHARAIKDAREYEALEEYAESYDHPADDAVYAQPA